MAILPGNICSNSEICIRSEVYTIIYRWIEWSIVKLSFYGIVSLLAEHSYYEEYV